MKSEFFETDSLLLAAYLLSKSCRFVRLDKIDPRKAIFVFKETEERKKLTELFLAHKALIEPHQFFSAQKDLKQMLYQR